MSNSKKPTVINMDRVELWMLAAAKRVLKRHSQRAAFQVYLAIRFKHLDLVEVSLDGMTVDAEPTHIHQQQQVKEPNRPKEKQSRDDEVVKSEL